MKFLLTTFAILVVSSGSLFAQQPDFRLTVSGALADKLAPDTQLRFWKPSADTSDWATFALADLPASLPFESFKGHQWHVHFSSKEAGSSFSVTLSPDLFDQPRLINIKLDAPRPNIRPVFSWLEDDVKYTGNITQRIRYRDFPRWNDLQKSLIRSQPPTMKITALSDGVVIYNQQMTDSCMGSKWWARIDRTIKLSEGETYRMSVIYDSGGLFPTATTQRDFTYWSALHGERQ